MTAPTLFDDPAGWADLSPCGTYRYLLGRRVGDGQRAALFVMLNPSTADASEDDSDDSEVQEICPAGGLRAPGGRQPVRLPGD